MEIYEEVNKVIDDIVGSIVVEVEDKGQVILLDPNLKNMIFNEWGDKLFEAIIEEVEGCVPIYNED